MEILPDGSKVRFTAESRYMQEDNIKNEVFEIIKYVPEQRLWGPFYVVSSPVAGSRYFHPDLLEPVPEKTIDLSVDLTTVNYMAEIIGQHSIAAFSHDYGDGTRVAEPKLHCECGEEFEGVTFESHAYHIAVELYNAGMR